MPTFEQKQHFVEAADSSEAAPQEWEGITGRMKQLLKVQDAITEKKIDEKTAARHRDGPYTVLSTA